MKLRKISCSVLCKIFILWIFFFLFCKESSSSLNDLQIKKKELEGNWTIIPSELGERLIINSFQGSYLIYGDEQEKEKIHIEVDNLGMQIYVGGVSMGYFLFDEKGKKIWTGIWNDEVVNLKRFDF